MIKILVQGNIFIESVNIFFRLHLIHWGPRQGPNFTLLEPQLSILSQPFFESAVLYSSYWPDFYIFGQKFKKFLLFLLGGRGFSEESFFSLAIKFKNFALLFNVSYIWYPFGLILLILLTPFKKDNFFSCLYCKSSRAC